MQTLYDYFSELLYDLNRDALMFVTLSDSMKESVLASLFNVIELEKVRCSISNYIPSYYEQFDWYRGTFVDDLSEFKYIEIISIVFKHSHEVISFRFKDLSNGEIYRYLTKIN